MPLITGCSQVKEVYGEAAELGVALPVFCAEDRETLEAILAAALEVGRDIGCEDLPVIPAWTCPIRTGFLKTRPSSISNASFVSAAASAGI